MVNFREFLLYESIRPKQHPYGTNYPDFDNKKFENRGTFTIIDGVLFNVGLKDKAEVVFARYRKTDDLSEYKRPMRYDFGVDYGNMGLNGIKIISIVFYISIQLLKGSNEKDITFKGNNNKLTRVYKRMLKSKPFIQELNNLGLRAHYDDTTEQVVFSKL